MNSAYLKTRTVTVKKADVYFDIDMLSLDYSRMAVDDVQKGDTLSTETATENGRRIIKRLCDHAAGEIRTLLEKFIDDTTSATTADNTFADTNWVFTLRLPTEAPDNILAPLADHCHQFIVNGALAEWYAHLGQNGNRESLQMRCNEAKERIRQLVFFRPQP